MPPAIGSAAPVSVSRAIPAIATVAVIAIRAITVIAVIGVGPVSVAVIAIIWIARADIDVDAGTPHHPHPAEAFEGVSATMAIATTNKTRTNRIFIGASDCWGLRIAGS